MSKYLAVKGSQISDKEAEIYGHRLEFLLKKNGSITPQLVIQDAENISSPLHAYFEWHDKVAAQQYRLEQARKLIRSIVLIPALISGEQPKIPMRAFYNIDSNVGGNSIREYVSYEEVISNPEYNAQIIAEAERRLFYWKETYKHFSQFDSVVNAIEEYVTKKEKLKA